MKWFEFTYESGFSFFRTLEEIYGDMVTLYGIIPANTCLRWANDCKVGEQFKIEDLTITCTE